MPSPAAVHVAARALTFAHGPTTVVRDVDLVVNQGERVGVIGPNGVGKSTLLHLLAGDLEPTAGSVTRHPPRTAVGFLHQELHAPDGITVARYLADRTGITAAETELDRSTAALAAGEPGADERYADALEAWTAAGVPDFEARLDRILDEVGLGASRASRAVDSLSGGEAARVDLAAVLLHQAPILLLDEPTNDLDLAGLDLLEESILDGRRGLAIVSHDRALLERTATTVVELDDHTRTATTYAGGWAAYERERAAAHERAVAAHEAYLAERDRLRARLHRQHQWSREGVHRARKNPEPDKNIRAGAIRGAQNLAAGRSRTAAELDRLEKVDKPWEGWELRLGFAEADRSGDTVARLDAAVVERGEFRLGPVDAEVGFGDRIRITGANGSGKSTLIDALLGRVQLAAGRHRLGSSVVVGELSQDRDDLAAASLVEGVVAAAGTTAEAARSSLAKLGLSAEEVGRDPATLSPGERTRAVLAVFGLRGVNLLVLDEPTNHLDLPAIEQLETALAGYGGTLLLVSHDRRFVETVDTARTWKLDGGRLTEV